jgi:hypothetical protein
MIRVQEKSYRAGRGFAPLRVSADEVEALAMNYKDLDNIGITLTDRELSKMMGAAMDGYGMDADLTAPLTTASITTPVQFLQAWLPGFVEVITAARRIDELVGIVTQGSWEDEEVVQGLMEYTGNAIPYGDYTNVPEASWNVNYERRTIVRFEEGMSVGRLEEARAAAIRANSPESKRKAAATALEIERNRVGFNGYNAGLNRTYGFLNDPQLPAYVTLPDGTGGTTNWADKTYLEIVSDLLTGYASLRTQSQDIIDPKRTPITLAIATNAVDFLSTVSQFGNSVQEWINENYPNTRVVSAPELNDANGGLGVFYMYAETVDESGSDDSRTFIQVVPNQFFTLGVEQRSKSYIEDYSNATAGIMLKRPYAVVRYSGVSGDT